jgi:[acyl-carrier-protein] S-malonyltransferase
MGREFYETTPVGKELFDQADALLGFPLTQLCFDGPKEDLDRTENTQPAIFTVSLIAWKLLEARGIQPAAMAGHSLGEYSAMVAAGVMSFEDGLRTVRRRGQLMAQGEGLGSGGMVVILGLPVDGVAEVCREASEAGVVEIANYNSPIQTVLSGQEAALERAAALAKERGAKRALRLPVSAPFHSSLMAPVAEQMEAVLAAVPMEAPRVPVVANVTADYVRTPEAIREALVRQVAGSVRWIDSIQRLAADGIEATVEAGPGKVLTGLTPRIVPGMTAMDTAEALLVSW